MRSSNGAPNATIDLSQPIYRDQLAKRIAAVIEEHTAKKYDDGHRTHLGASLIGHDCQRYLWYVFRWVKHVKQSGRQQRLFNRGHREEERWLEWLEDIGAQVHYFDDTAPMTLLWCADFDHYIWKETAKLKESDYEHEGHDHLDVTDKICTNVEDVPVPHVTRAKSMGFWPDYPQIRVTGCGGHFGGSIDNLVKLPAYFNVPHDLVFVNEFKTSKTGAKFDNLVKNGVKAEKYQHYCQMCIYGRKRNLRYGIYMCVNKNDDTIHVEVIELDWALAERLEIKAERIILSAKPPMKLSESITFRTCSYCDMNDVCHKAVPYEKNCRSCAYARPVDQAQWYCDGWQGIIPADVIAKGCDNWSANV